MLLLIGLINSQASKADNVSSTRKLSKDTANITVTIDAIRTANIKMIERDYYYMIVKQQDSIIMDKDKYINIQKEKENDYKKIIENNNKELVKIRNDMTKQKNKNNIYKSGFGISILGLLLTLLLK